MANGIRRMAARFFLAATAVVILALLPCSAPFVPWQIYTLHDGFFRPLPTPLCSATAQPPNHPTAQLPNHPTSQPPNHPTWRTTASVLADATNDGALEWVLLVWRPWQDWPIQRWSSAPSPIAGFHDAAGESCHLILLHPHDGREIWAGSALPAPLLALAVGDVDGDRRNEVVTLEGDYTTGRGGPASRVDVWRWNGFGFALEWRSPPGDLRELRLTDANNDGVLDLAVR